MTSKSVPLSAAGSKVAAVSGSKAGSQMVPAGSSKLEPKSASKPASLMASTARSKVASPSAPPASAKAPAPGDQGKGSVADLYNIESSGPGQPLTAAELQKLKEEGKLGHDIDVAMNPALYKLKDEKGAEKLVLLVDAPPCGCRKVMGKKERCRKHRAVKRSKKKEKKEKKQKKSGGVRDDDSDRLKLGALRHAEDSEEEADQPIEGAITPDKVCVVGPAGAGILIPIDMTDNPNAGPRAPAEAPNATGILIKGPQDCPQFIPDAKIPKDERGVPKYTIRLKSLN